MNKQAWIVKVQFGNLESGHKVWDLASEALDYCEVVFDLTPAAIEAQKERALSELRTFYEEVLEEVPPASLVWDEGEENTSCRTLRDGGDANWPLLVVCFRQVKAS